MPKITLPYFIYWSVACIFIGILLAARIISPMPTSEDHSTHFNHDHVMKHNQIEVDASNSPSIKIKITKDRRGSSHSSANKELGHVRVKDLNYLFDNTHTGGTFWYIII